MHSINFTAEFIYPMLRLTFALFPSQFCRIQRSHWFSSLWYESRVHAAFIIQQQKRSFIEAHFPFRHFWSECLAFQLYSIFFSIFLIHSLSIIGKYIICFIQALERSARTQYTVYISYTLSPNKTNAER